MFKLLVREPDPKLTLDHLKDKCISRACCNVDHLEEVTSKENVLRGNGLTALNARKTHCLNGHKLSGDNLYIACGKRHCKECRRQFKRIWRVERKRLGLRYV
jgi:hypothetical protein